MLNPTPKSLRRNIHRSIAMAILCSPLFIAANAQAAPLPKDWCGRLWGVRTTPNTAIVWDNPATGASSTAVPTTNVAAIPTLPAAATYPAYTYLGTNYPASTSGYAALAIHARSGTLYTLDRGNHTLYQYSMSTGVGWTSTVLSQIPNIATIQPTTAAQSAATNFNKMTVAGDKLIIASSDSKTVYTYDLTPATGALTSSTGTAATYSFDLLTTLPNGTTGDPSIPIRVNSTISTNNTGTSFNDGVTFLNLDTIGGGDIAQDEYGEYYNVIYDTYPSINTTTASSMTPQYAYIYKRNGTVWEFKKRVQKVSRNDAFAGLAFYNDVLYVKGTAGQLFKLPLARTGTGADYDWGAAAAILTTVGAVDIGVNDLASCGVPAISVTKTQQLFTDAAATPANAVPASTPPRIVTGQYIKYTIVATNTGDAWSRNTFIKDALPAGVTYVPNSATLNGTNLGAAIYPFAPPPVTVPVTPAIPINSPSAADGIITLGITAGTSNISTITYVVKIDGTTASVQNQAEVGYENPYPSDPPNCLTGLNCGVSTSPILYPSIFGNVWNDINGSAAGTFTSIKTGTETGTNAGTTVGATNALYAILLNSAGKEIASSPVAADGSYKFLGLNPSQTGLNIQLSTTAGTVNTTTPVNPPAVGIPTGWKATSPKATSSIAVAPNPITSFNLALVDVLDKDFGITLPAGIILVKRITAINGLTTNNGTDLTAVVNPTTTTTTNDDATRKWPPGYLKGAVGATTVGGPGEIKVKPGDTIEYTIYYLNDGSADAKKLKICDPIRGNHTYDPNSMKMLPGGLADLAANYIPLTDGIALGVDRANSYASGAANVPGNCNAVGSTATGGSGSSPQPDLPVIPGATAAGSPTSSYGSFRFRTKVNP
jgi:uncharacterized repeat protein (TIGR01451 family)